MKKLVIMGGILCAAAFATTAFGQDRGGLRRAPANPEFQRYALARASGAPVARTFGGHPLGVVPTPVLPSPVQPQARKVDRALPPSFDLRTTGKLPPVRTMGECAAGWAFAAMGSLESYLLPGQPFDFSEKNMIDTAGFWYTPCGGGSLFTAAAYMARWSGPLLESQAPWSQPSGADGAEAAPATVHVQDVQFITGDNRYLKEIITTNGAVYVTMEWIDGAYNPATNSYYYTGPADENGRTAVAMVGWDDNYPASNFSVMPPGNGAFIARSSWGPEFGDAGYFYVSYHDTRFAQSGFNGFVTSEAATNYGAVYQYDKLGWVDQYGDGTSFTAWGANIFTASAGSQIQAVSTYGVSPELTYEIYVYTGVTPGVPRSGTLKATVTGFNWYASYFTVKLPSPVAVAAGEKFSVVVKYTTPGYAYPIPVEEFFAYYAENVTSNPGESFWDLTGTENTAWTDISATDLKSNVCIKAFTTGGKVKPKITVTSPAADTVWTRGTESTVTWTSVGKVNPIVKIFLFRGGAKVKTISARTENDGSFTWLVPAKLKPGTKYVVKVVSKDGSRRGVSPKFTIAAAPAG